MADLIELAESGKLTFTWRGVGDKKMCEGPETNGGCARLHGEGGRTLAEWQSLGLPATGHTNCQGNCRCMLLPDNLLEVESEILEPFEIGPVIRGEEAETPLEAARLAMNSRLLDDLPPGTVVRYRGDVGTVGVVRSKKMIQVSIDGGVTRNVFDFTELTVVG